MRKRCLVMVGACLLGCANAGPLSTEPEDGFVVEDGKEDNFYSLLAQEYVVEGRGSVTVEEGKGLSRAKKLISLEHVAIAWFLNQYLIDKDSKDANYRYGGFSSIVKTGSYEDLAIEKTGDLTYEFRFAQVISGPKNLMSQLDLEGGEFDVEIGKPTNDELEQLDTNNEWYRKAPWNAWDPDKVPAAQKERLTLSIRKETVSADAWWDYKRLLDGDKLTIDVYFGWDYHSEYHLKHSRKFYGWLIDHGFRSPVSSYEKYKRTSGAFKKTLEANGKDIDLEVRFFYGRVGTDTDPDTDAGGRVLENQMRESLRTRDVIMFSGHSGPFYGFALANWKKTDEGDLDDSDMLTATMPASKYQVVLAEGCDTYMIGQALLDNRYKRGKNIDVVTTTTSSDASTPAVVQDFVAKLIETNSADEHRPRTLHALLEALDDDSWGTMYGVHGIDDNPRIHPYARTGKLCDTCDENADCGPVGNSCVRVGQSGKRCVAACIDDSGCPTGYKCKSIASSSSGGIYAKSCAPADNVCE